MTSAQPPEIFHWHLSKQEPQRQCLQCVDEDRGGGAFPVWTRTAGGGAFSVGREDRGGDAFSVDEDRGGSACTQRRSTAEAVPSVWTRTAEAGACTPGESRYRQAWGWPLLGRLPREPCAGAARAPQGGVRATCCLWSCHLHR